MIASVEVVAEKKALITGSDVTQSFPLPGGRQFIAIKQLYRTFAEGDFVSLIRQLGLGKSIYNNICP